MKCNGPDATGDSFRAWKEVDANRCGEMQAKEGFEHVQGTMRHSCDRSMKPAT